MSNVRHIPGLIRDLYAIVRDLETLFPGRRFTLDGHLVGSIGEVLAAHDYDLRLLPASANRHDARAADGRFVQIKATQGTRVAISSRPQHLVVLRIERDGLHHEVYNGPGGLVWPHVSKPAKNGQRSISIARLRALNETVPPGSRLRLRSRRAASR